LALFVVVAVSGRAPAATLSYAFTNLADFNSLGAVPDGAVTMDAAGNIWGTLSTDQTRGTGGVFEITAKAGGGFNPYVAANPVFTFSSSTYSGAYGSVSGLITDSSGNIYGTTKGGGTGTGAGGTVFEIKPGASPTLTVMASFSNAATGGNPYQGLVIDPSTGYMYGTTRNYGTVSSGTASGTIFRLVPNGASSTITSLYNFTNTAPSGYDPQSTLVMDANGNLYGTTEAGGGSGCYGTIFKYNIAGNTLTSLANLTTGGAGTMGCYP
jgi:uncharacterized repeat protein (TIGR03803 family)